MEGNILSGGRNELNLLKDTLSQLNQYKDNNDTLTAEEAKLEKTIKAKEKAIADEISGTTKKRKEEIEATYNDQIDKTRNRIKKIKSRKEKSKIEKKSERIETETAGLKEEYRQMLLECKDIFKQNKIPSFLNSKYFYSLFLPKTISDIMIILFTLIVILLVIPCTFYFYIIPVKNMGYLVLIYFLTVVLFGGLYMLIDNNIKDKHIDAIIKVRKIRNQILENKKKRNKIKNSILNDKDESSYGLDQYNEELTDLENELQTIMEQKKDALNIFENTTRFVIGEEIKVRNQEELNALKLEYGKVYAENRDTEDKIKSLSVEISNTYEVFLGKEFMSLEKVGILAGIMEEQKLNTISEAIAYYKENN